jgi:hypothetical protein
VLLPFDLMLMDDGSIYLSEFLKAAQQQKIFIVPTMQRVIF